MSDASDLRNQAAKLRAEMQQLNAKAQTDESASDEAVDRYNSEDLKVKAEELERKASDIEKEEQAKNNPPSSLF